MTPSPGLAAQAAGPLDWTLVWTIISVLVMVIAIFTGMWATRRWGSRRTVLRVDYRIRPLRPFHLTTADGTTELIRPNPPIQFDLELRITNKGPQDILPEHFGGQDLTFGVAPGRIHTGILRTNWKSASIRLDPRYAKIPPRRIAVKNALYFSVRVIDDRPLLFVATPLANVKVHVRRHRDQDADVVGFFSLSGSNKGIGRGLHEM